jgi:hypothetical protein
VAESVDDLITTILTGEGATARRAALETLLRRSAASRDLLVSLTEHADVGIATLATHALIETRSPDELFDVFDDLLGDARDRVALRLLGSAPERAVERVIAALGPVPKEPRVARALAEAIVDTGDPRAQAVLLELVIAQHADASHLDAASRAALLDRARDAPESERLNLIGLVVRQGPQTLGSSALPGAIADALRADASGTVPWRLVWSACLLPREDLYAPGRDPVSHALYYARDHRPQFVPPPERWEDDERRLAIRFALERPELHADVLGWLRRLELDVPDDDPRPGSDDNPTWPLCAVLDHLGRPLYPHPHAASFVRGRSQREVNAAIDHIGPAFADPDRFEGDLEERYAQLRVRSRKRIAGWARKRG